MRKQILAALLVLWGVALAAAQQFGTAEEARAMLDKAVAALKASEAAAIAAFNDKSGGFRDRDLYVFCFNAKTGNTVAHPNPALVNTDVRAFNFKGDPIGQRLFDAVQGTSVTTVDYVFPKPGTTQPVAKVSFVRRVGELGCGVGYYK